MKIFVVNLDRDKERLASIDAQLKAQGLEYERFPAIWAAGLSAEERRRYIDAFRWWCVTGYKARAGEIGCTATHNKIYERMVEKNIPIACIFEDDAQLADCLCEGLRYLEEHVRGTENKVFILTNYTSYRQDEFGIVPSRQDQSTEAYVITREAAKSILKVNDPMVIACDHWQWFAKRGGISVCQVFPTACLHGEARFGSYSSPPGTEKDEVKNLSIGRWVLHKGMRCVGRTIDWVLYKVWK